MNTQHYDNRDVNTTTVYTVTGEQVDIDPIDLFLNMVENNIENDDISWLDAVEDKIKELRHEYNV